MKEKLTNDRGQVGIGTLIVFIALVLVAAIAAGVLINTAGFLQTQAEQTGEDSTDQVADNVNVIGEVGDVKSMGGPIDNAKLTLQRSPGSQEIDLKELSIQYVGDNGFAQLVHGSKGSGNPGYEISAITAESTGSGVITADGDRYQITIDFAGSSTGSDDTGSVDYDNSDLNELKAGQRAELEITTQAGATRNVVIAAPDSLVGLDSTDTVTL